MTALVGTEFYRRVILGGRYHDAETADLMRRIWSVTPHVAEVETAGLTTKLEMTQWLRAIVGAEADPIRGVEGLWQWGHATVDGMTWLGFAHQHHLYEFMKDWRGPRDRLC